MRPPKPGLWALPIACNIDAASLLEGLEEALIVHRLKIPGMIREILCSTNLMESANSACRGIIRRVSNFKDGGMALRHAAGRLHGSRMRISQDQRIQAIANAHSNL